MSGGEAFAQLEAILLFAAIALGLCAVALGLIAGVVFARGR